MNTIQLAKKIQNEFDLNHIYAKNIVYSLSNLEKLSIEEIGNLINEKPKPFVKW